MAIIDRSTLDYSSWSIPVAQIVFLASVCLINRIASVKTLSWVSGVRTFRAGLLCISSAVFLQSLHTQSTATQQLGHTIEKCCRTLAQLAISFTDLSMHSSILSQLLRDISSGNPIPEELFQSLRTSDEQKSARQIMQWLQGNPGIEVTDQALSQHLFMLFNVLGHMNDDEKALRDFLFN
jgi:hypothetical protein